MRKTPYTICAQLGSMVLLRVIGIGLTGILSVVGAHAQVTVAGFTNVSGFQDLKIGTSFVTDIYDQGNTGLDVTKQNGLNGSNTQLDLIGNSSFSTVQIATGTVLVSSVATAAMEFRVRLADYSNNGFKTASVIALLQNGSSVFGIGMGVAANGNFVLASITSNAGTTLDKSYQYTGASISTDSNRYSYTSTTSGISSSGDAFITFVVLSSELSAISPGFTFGSTTGVSVFTTNTGSLVGSGNINADYITSDNQANSSLAFASTSGTTTPVPEFSTSMILGMVLLPPIGIQLLRRRRRANTASLEN